MVVSTSALRRGHRLRGLLVASLAVAGVFLLMAHQGHVPHGSVWGTLLLLLSLASVLRAMGLLDPSEEGVPLRSTSLFPMDGEVRGLSPMVMLPLAVGTALLGMFLPSAQAGFIVAGLLLLLPAALRRPGLLLFVLVSLAYLPALGLYGLWDPWETHYGEVSREILARDDWISLWWAQDGWFWSKPILIFWANALAWSASGIPFMPDTHFAGSEWVLRLPVFALSMGAVLSVYHLVKFVWSPKAGLLAGLCLATSPLFAFLSHQAITDMYFVANMTMAMMAFVAAVSVNADAQTTSLRIGRYALSAQHAVIGLLFMIAVPQLLYLASRNVALVDGYLFAWHLDDFLQGSAGNGGVPGNNPVSVRSPVYRSLWVQPMAQALYYSGPLLYLIVSLRKERRLRPLLMVAFYVLCALAFMGKGIPGFALPALVALLWLVAQRRFSLLLSGELLIARGALIVSVLGLPWFVAMFVRHGTAFTDRLLIHDHINRLTSGVHGDKGSIQYFIAQLGYGMFPWVALAPLAVMVLLRKQVGDAGERRAQALAVLGLWFVATFTLFSAMATKFHHYIFPAVPPAAILVGLSLHELLQARAEASRKSLALGAWLAMCAALCWLIAAGGYFGDLRGVLPADLPTAQRAVWAPQHALMWWASLAWIVAGAACFYAAARVQRGLWSIEGPAENIGAGGAFLLGAALCAFVGRDLTWTTGERPAGQERLIQLFVYKYDRPFPDDLDYRAAFAGFAVVTVALCLLAVAARLRPIALQCLLGLSLLYCAYDLNVYMVDLSPHWGQRELIDRYYAKRKGPKEPLLAWQMNWKGENFYTGNRVAAFQSLDNKQVNDYIAKHKGTRAFFILEHQRLDRFDKMLSPRKVAHLTSKRDCNKFILVSAEL